MENKSTDFENIMWKTETISDNIVWKIYNKWLVEKIESLDFIKTLVKSSFIKAIQGFWEGWFKQIFVFFWYVSIIFWAISVLIGIVWLFNVLSSIWFLISALVWICLSLISIIVWFWMVKFKQWYPFVVLIQWAAYLLSTVVSFIVMNSYYRWLVWVWSLSGLLVNIWIFLAIYTVFFALVLKNKELFAWKRVVQTAPNTPTKTKTAPKTVVKKAPVKKETIKKEL